jgi:hypothetical protein
MPSTKWVTPDELTTTTPRTRGRIAPGVLRPQLAGLEPFIPCGDGRVAVKARHIIDPGLAGPHAPLPPGVSSRVDRRGGRRAAGNGTLAELSMTTNLECGPIPQAELMRLWPG